MKEEDLDLVASLVREGLTKWFAAATPEQIFMAVFDFSHLQD
jgi:hypothetical protein